MLGIHNWPASNERKQVEYAFTMRQKPNQGESLQIKKRNLKNEIASQSLACSGLSKLKMKEANNKEEIT